MSDVLTGLTRIKKGWVGGLPETPCGFGSTLRATKQQRDWIPRVIEKYEIQTISDIGAGDLNWIKHTHIPNEVEYTPYDLYPRLPEVKKFNLSKQVPKKVDMIMCLWVLSHLKPEDREKAMDNIKASGAHYLLMTHRGKYEDEIPYIEILPLRQTTEKHDSIRLVDLWTI
jgi:hypothetical protein